MKNRTEYQELWDSIKKCNIIIIGIPDREGREDGAQEIFEIIMAEHFPKRMTDTKQKILEAQGTPNRINIKESHI